MGWVEALENQVCEGCGDELPEGEEVFQDGDNNVWCEGCHEEPEHDDEYDLIDGVGFADPGGNSSLRAETPSNPRDQDCPTCRAKNVLTRIDRRHGYQCNRCADKAERGGDY